MTTLLFVFTLSMYFHQAVCQSGEQFTRLHEHLYRIHPSVRPVKNISVQTTINVSFHLMSINSFDTVSQKLYSNGWLLVIWKDEFMVWNPNDFGGVWRVFPEPEKVWRPKLTVVNSMKDLKPIGMEYVVLEAQNDGTVIWYPAESFETFCSVDITYFPFDIQHCQLEIMIWAGDFTELILQPFNSEIYLDSFVGNSEWIIINTSLEKVFRNLGNSMYPNLVCKLSLRRRPILLVMTVLTPVAILAFVNTFVFIIPFDSDVGKQNDYGGE